MLVELIRDVLQYSKIILNADYIFIKIENTLIKEFILLSLKFLNFNLLLY